MGVKYLKTGEDFGPNSFPTQFGFTGSAQGGNPALPHATNPPGSDEFGNGSYVDGQALKNGGRVVKRALGGPVATDPRMAMAQQAMRGTYPPGGPMAQPAPMMRPGQGMSGPGMGQPAMLAKGGAFIKKAIKRPGALTQKADAAGESVSGFAAKHEHDAGLTGNQARFYEGVLKPASKHKKG